MRTVGILSTRLLLSFIVGHSSTILKFRRILKTNIVNLLLLPESTVSELIFITVKLFFSVSELLAAGYEEDMNLAIASNEPSHYKRALIQYGTHISQQNMRPRLKEVRYFVEFRF